MKDPFHGTPFWRPSAEERAALLRHLMAELPVGHVLWTHRDSLAVEARDRDGDRIAVTSGAKDIPAAIVQMSWAGRPAMAPFLPETTGFGSLEDLIAEVRSVEAP